MAVTSASEINDGRGGEIAYQDDGTTVATRRRRWRVETNDNADDDVAVLAYAGIPNIGAAHPNHAACKCIRSAASPESAGQKRHWLATATYSTKWNILENPLQDPARTEWSTESYQTPVVEDIDGDAIINSAGDPFDPPAEKDDSRWVSITRKNVADSVPAWIFAYQDGVNSDSYTVDGKLIDPGEAKISAIHLGETQTRNEIDYRVLTVTIHYRGEGDDAGSSGYGPGGGGDEVEPWDLSLLDAGMREIGSEGSGSCAWSGLRPIRNCDGSDVMAPVPLNGEGFALDDPTPSTSIFLQFEVYRKREFALIEAMFS